MTLLTRHVDEVLDVDASEAVGRLAGVDARVVEFEVTDVERVLSHAKAFPAEMYDVTVLLPLNDGGRFCLDGTRQSKLVASAHNLTSIVAGRNARRTCNDERLFLECTLMRTCVHECVRTGVRTRLQADVHAV